MIKVYYNRLENDKIEMTKEMLTDILSYIKRQNEEIDKIKNYVQNNREYVNDIMKQYFDMILYIINEGEQNEN